MCKHSQMLKVHHVSKSIWMDGSQVFRLSYRSESRVLLVAHLKKSNIPIVTVRYTYISVSSGRLEKTKAPIVSKARFSDMYLKRKKKKT